MTNGKTDTEILRGVAANDADAIDRWYRIERPIVYRLCLGFLADVHEAEDAMQDALVKLMDRVDDGLAARSWSRWRNTVVANLCRDRLRRGRRGLRLLDEATELPDTLPDPAASMRQEELRRVLAETLRRLAVREREVFVLHELEGVPTPDVARALGIGESSVRSLLSLARRRLRKMLGHRLAGLGRRQR